MTNNDHDHLKLLSAFHYVVAGMTALFSLFPIIHLIVGISLILGGDKMATDGGEPPPAFLGWAFAIVGGSIIAMGETLAICILAAGRMLAKRRAYMFCFVIAGLETVLMPFGTVLGVFTIIVLTRDSVKEAFAENKVLESTSQ